MVCCLLWFGSNIQYHNPLGIAIRQRQSYQKVIILKSLLSLCRQYPNREDLSHTHRLALGVFFVIVWLVAHGNFLLLDPPHQLALYMIPCRMGRWWSLLEDPAHVVE